MNARGGLLARTHRLLESLAAPALAPFLAQWPAAAAQPSRSPGPTSSLPVLRWLARIAGDQACVDPELVAALCAAAPLLAWRQTYTREEVGASFLQEYGWSELLAPAGGRGGVACGVLLLGPHTLYPPHRHEADEVYVPLSGVAEWQSGASAFRDAAPGTVIHHPSEESHAMRTGEQPLLAIYLWRSADLSQKARLDLRRAG
jgi:mannose-6-phosphate isomerase-like protein (cupin superfamily)